ncbi:NtaA/DmoA family FMN-dependent monooxygenase [Agromyces sp. PvR057]|uniref:NtaA/DmoA family FMN-dependent monooxygenase n=1 Tax=Agromyces sp. PvR057 TaxID=3156403 RepID=UPI00339335CA
MATSTPTQADPPQGKRQVHLAAHFPGVNSTTLWADPLHRSQIDFTAFEHFARTAERGRFDYLFLAEGLRLREHKGQLHELDVVGRPNTLAVLAALAAVTEHIGLVGTLNSTFNEPYELARQLSTLDHLSDGRAGWNVVTSSDAFHGANFRRGGYLDHADRYHRANEFVSLAKELWDSWSADAIVADRATGRYLAEDADAGAFAHRGAQFDVRGRFTTPASPQRYPVIVQAGDSADGRDFASEHAEVIFSRHSAFEEARAFYADVKGRLAGWGRTEDSLKILPAVTFAIGDTQAEAEEVAREISLAQVTPRNAITALEQLWGTDLTNYDADGPLPAFDPGEGPADTVAGTITKGWAPRFPNAVPIARAWRAQSEAEGLSIRELVIKVAGRQSFIGTPSHIAAELDRYVQERATDGFVVVGTTSPHGLDAFVERVVPELQDRGVHRTEYEPGSTLRQNLGLPEPGARDAAVRDAEEVRRVG